MSKVDQNTNTINNEDVARTMSALLDRVGGWSALTEGLVRWVFLQKPYGAAIWIEALHSRLRALKG